MTVSAVTDTGPWDEVATHVDGLRARPVYPVPVPGGEPGRGELPLCLPPAGTRSTSHRRRGRGPSVSTMRLLFNPGPDTVVYNDAGQCLDPDTRTEGDQADGTTARALRRGAVLDLGPVPVPELYTEPAAASPAAGPNGEGA